MKDFNLHRKTWWMAYPFNFNSRFIAHLSNFIDQLWITLNGKYSNLFMAWHIVSTGFGDKCQKACRNHKDHIDLGLPRSVACWNAASSGKSQRKRSPSPSTELSCCSEEKVRAFPGWWKPIGSGQICLPDHWANTYQIILYPTGLCKIFMRRKIIVQCALQHLSHSAVWWSKLASMPIASKHVL